MDDERIYRTLAKQPLLTIFEPAWITVGILTALAGRSGFSTACFALTAAHWCTRLVLANLARRAVADPLFEMCNPRLMQWCMMIDLVKKALWLSATTVAILAIATN